MIKLNITHIKYAAVCRKSGISMSSAFYQVKHNILERLNISGFQGFKKSRTLVEDLLRISTSRLSAQMTSNPVSHQ